MLSALKRKIGGIGYCPHGGGGGGGTQYSTTQNYSPEEAARRTRVMDTGEDIYNRTAPAVAQSPYPGSVPVGPNPTTIASWDWLYNNSIPSATRVAQAGEGAVTRGLDPSMLYAESNPYLQSAINAAIRPMQDQFLDAGGTLSGIRTNAIDAGGQGASTRQGIAEGLAASRANRDIGDVAARMASEGYGQALTHQARMAALAPSVQDMAFAPAEAINAVGTQQEGYEQNMNDYAAATRAWELEREWGPLQNWANIVFGGGSSQSTAISQAASPQRNRALGALGGAASGYALGSMIPGFGLPGAAIGGMLGMFS